MDNVQLSPHFSLKEFTDSDTAARNGIDNTPPPVIMPTLYATAAHMEQVRTFLTQQASQALWGRDVAIFPSSVYRCRELNRAVGSDDTSAHVLGWGVDFRAPSFGDPLAVCKAIAASSLFFDQLIFEINWAHIAFGPQARRQVLTAHFTPGQRPTYTEGL